MKKHPPCIVVAVAILVLGFGPFGLSSARAAITYNFDDGTMQGWANIGTPLPNNVWVSRTGGDPGAGQSVPNFIGIDNWDARDDSASVLWARSPVFYLDGSGDLAFYLAGGTGAGVGALPKYDSQVDIGAGASGSGFMGLALRNATTGEFVLKASRTGVGGNWQGFSFTAVQLVPYVGTGAFTLDFIDNFSGGWGWVGLDTVRIPGTATAPGAMWKGGNSGNVWNASSNWINNPQDPESPNGPRVAVTFGDSGSLGNGAVTLDVARTVGSVTFKADVPTTIAGTSLLTLDSGNMPAVLFAAGNTHVISTAMKLNSDLAITVGTGSLTLSGVISDGGMSITKSGSGLLDLAGNSLSPAKFTLIGGTVTGTGSITAGSAYDLRQGIVDIVLQGNQDLNKSTGDTVVLNKANTFTGSTNVSAGTLSLANAGAIANSPSIVVAGGATLDASAVGGLTLAANRTLSGAGTINGNLTATGAKISVDAGGVLTVTGSTALNDGTVLNLGIGDGTQQRLDTTGALALAGTVNLNIAPVGFVVTGTSYTLMQHGGLTGTGSFSAPVVFRGMTLDTTTDPTKVQMTVGAAAKLTWVGGAAGNKWNVNAAANWYNTDSSTTDVFYHMDHVLFDDSGTANNTVTLVGNVAPRDVTVNVSAGNAYTLTGSGSIIGPTGIAKSGGGTLTIANVNTFGGVDSSGNPLGIVSIHEGEIRISAGGVLTNKTSEIDVGDTAGLTGRLTLSGGTAIVPIGSASSSGVQVGMNGGTGVLTMSGNSLIDASPYNGFYNGICIGTPSSVGSAVVGGTATLRLPYSGVIGVGEGGTGSLTVQEQGVVQAETFHLGSTGYWGVSGGTGALHLNGGTLSVPTVQNDGGTTGTLYFNGGTLQATADSTDFISAGGTLNTYVQTGSAVIDTNGHNITINQSLSHDAGGPASDGGLIKTGSGTLILAASANTYTGGTTVNNGTLQQGAAGALPALTSLRMGSAGNIATLDLGGHNASLATLATGAGATAAQQTIGNSGSSAAQLLVDGGTASSAFGGTIRDGLTVGGTGQVSLWLASGNLTLSGTNTYSGGTTVETGTLRAANADALPTGNNLTILGSGHVVLSSGLAHAISLGGLTITSGAGGGSAPAFGSSAADVGYQPSAAAAAPTPEPGTMLLLAAGALAGLAAWRRRRIAN